MKKFTAIYDTESMKGIQYSFRSLNIEAAEEFVRHKFDNINILAVLETPELFKENDLINLFEEVKNQNMLDVDGGSSLEIKFYGKPYTLFFHNSWGGMVALNCGSEKIGSFKKFQFKINRGKDSIYHLVRND